MFGNYKATFTQCIECHNGVNHRDYLFHTYFDFREPKSQQLLLDSPAHDPFSIILALSLKTIHSKIALLIFVTVGIISTSLSWQSICLFQNFNESEAEHTLQSAEITTRYFFRFHIENPR